MADLLLKTAIQTLGHTQALKDGTVKPQSFAFEFEEVSPIIKAFRRMVRHRDFDISEMALTTYICAKSHGKRLTALPIFVVRAFHHGAILVNAKSGITDPKQLEGGRVGVNRGYTVTTGVWARGIMQDEYGVDLGRITWVLSGDEHVEEFRPGPNVISMPQGRTLEDMLAAGELDAAIGIASDNPDIQPLIPDAEEHGFRLLAENGHYPINHTIVVRDELLEADPGLAQDIYDAFVQSKQRYLQHLANDQIEKPVKADKTYRRVMQTIHGDPLPYGLDANRAAIESVIRYAREQAIIQRPFRVEELFFPVRDN